MEDHSGFTIYLLFIIQEIFNYGGMGSPLPIIGVLEHIIQKKLV